MGIFQNTLKTLRNSQNLTQDELAKRLKISRSAIGMYENGSREPDFETLELIADFFNVDIDYLLGRTNKTTYIPDQSNNIPAYPNIHPIGTVRLPVLGEIACGVPRYASEDRESYTLAGTDIHADFCLIAHGDSMTGARINDGDIVFIRKQDIVENGEIAAVVIGDEATLKRFFYYREKELLILRAENPKYPDLIYTGAELEAVHVLGLAIAFQSDVQ